MHPGTYTLGAAGEERQPNFFGKTITVVDQDIADLLVTVDLGFTLTGQVTPPQETQLHLEVSMEEMGFSTMLQAAGSFMVNGRSNAEGAFTLKGVGRGDYKLVAQAESGDKGTLDIQVSADMDGIALTMEERASADGFVVDASGRPVEGVTVNFTKDGKRDMPGFNMMRPGAVTITGPDGGFHHVGLEDGGYGVTVQDGIQLAWAGKDDEAAYAPHHIDVKDRGDVHGLRLAIISRNESIRGSVVGPTGAPLADAWVTAKFVPDANSSASQQWSPGEDPVLTDASGRFEVTGLRDGMYDLVAEGMRGGAKGEAEKVATGSDVTITLASLGAVGGVVSRGGNPVGDFIISAVGPTRRRAHIVADNGEFHLRRLEPGEYTIEVTSSEGVATTSATVKSGEEASATITLAAFGNITGTLVDVATGEPLVGISVAASVGESGSKWAENAMDMLQGKGPTTDEEGRFNVGKLGTGDGVVYFIDPEAKGFGMVAQQPFKLDAGESIDLGEIKGRRAVTIPKDKRGTLAMQIQVGTAAAVCSDAKTAEGLAADSEHLWITSVADEGPAAQAGAARCDRILAVQGVSLEQAGPQGLQMLLENVEVGKSVTIVVQTASGETTLSIDPALVVDEDEDA